MIILMSLKGGLNVDFVFCQQQNYLYDPLDADGSEAQFLLNYMGPAEEGWKKVLVLAEQWRRIFLKQSNTSCGEHFSFIEHVTFCFHFSFLFFLLNASSLFSPPDALVWSDKGLVTNKTGNKTAQQCNQRCKDSKTGLLPKM